MVCEIRLNAFDLNCVVHQSAGPTRRWKRRVRGQRLPAQALSMADAIARPGTRATLGVRDLDRHWLNARIHTLHEPVRWKYAILGNYTLNDANPPLHAWS